MSFINISANTLRLRDKSRALIGLQDKDGSGYLEKSPEQRKHFVQTTIIVSTDKEDVFILYFIVRNDHNNLCM